MTRKILDLKFNISKDKKYPNKDSANFYTGDVGVSTLRIQLMNDNKKANLIEMDMKPAIKIKDSKGMQWNALEVIELVPEFGLVQINLPNDLVLNGGEFTGIIYLEGEMQNIHVANFSFVIKES